MSILDGLTQQTAAGLAERWIDDELPKLTYPENVFSGRGVVIVAGGTKYLIPAWVCVRALRYVGCKLPIQIWYRGETERIQTIETLLRPYDVEFVDAFAVRDAGHPHENLGGWETKPFAIQWCPWEEVLFLDADNVPVRDPTYLFEDRHYKRTGTVLWPDYHRLGPERAAWRVFGVPYAKDYEREVESGQIVIDKRRAWRPLWLCHWYGERSKFFFNFVYGDKELFHLGWLKAATPYAMTATPIKTLKGTMCQHDFTGARVFQHRNARKWAMDCSQANDTRPGFMLERECFGWLDELKRHWSPAAGTFLDQADLDAAKALIGTRYTYTRMQADGKTPQDTRELLLWHGGLIADGAAGCEWYWCLRAGRLCIAGRDGKATMDLISDGAGGWSGAWLRYEKMRVDLRPV